MNDYQLAIFYQDGPSGNVLIEAVETQADDDYKIVQLAEETMKKGRSGKQFIRAIVVSRTVKILGDPKIFARAQQQVH